MTSLSEKLSSSVIESASENENQNSSSSDNETFPDSPVKQKRKRRCIHLLFDGYERNIDTVETGRIMKQMIMKKF